MKRTRSDLKGTPDVPFMRETRTTIETERYIAVLSPDGSSLSALNTDGGDWDTYTMPHGVNGIPIEGTHVIALALAGHAVRELAVFAGKWRHPNLAGADQRRIRAAIAGHASSFTWWETTCTRSASRPRRWDALHLTGNEEPTCGSRKSRSSSSRAICFTSSARKLGEWSKGVRDAAEGRRGTISFELPALGAGPDPTLGPTVKSHDALTINRRLTDHVCRKHRGPRTAA